MRPPLTCEPIHRSVEPTVIRNNPPAKQHLTQLRAITTIEAPQPFGVTPKATTRMSYGVKLMPSERTIYSSRSPFLFRLSNIDSPPPNQISVYEPYGCIKPFPIKCFVAPNVHYCTQCHLLQKWHQYWLDSPRLFMVGLSLLASSMSSNSSQFSHSKYRLFGEYLSQMLLSGFSSHL